MNSLKLSVLTMFFPHFFQYQFIIINNQTLIQIFFILFIYLGHQSHKYFCKKRGFFYVLSTQYFHSKLHFINGYIFMICSSRDEKQYGALLLMPSASFTCIYLHFLQKITTSVILTIKQNRNYLPEISNLINILV